MKDSKIKSLYVKEPTCVELNEANVPAFFESADAEYDVIRNEIAIVDGVGSDLLEVSGDDAAAFLDALTTKEAKYLNTGKSFEALVLDDDANVLGICTVINNDGKFIVMVPPENAKKVTAQFESKKSEYSVEIKDMLEDSYMFYLEGEKSWKLVAKLFDFPVETVLLRDMTKVEFEGSEVILTRIGRTGEYAYSIIAKDDKLESLVKAILAFDEVKVSFAGLDALKVCMLETNQPITTDDVLSQGSVLELAYQWFIQFEKEEYVGHDALMSQFEGGVSKVSTGFSFDGKEDLVGKDVSLDGEVVGKVFVSAYDKGLDKTIGYAFINSDLAVSNAQFDVDCGKISTISVPFVRPHSWDSTME